LLPSVTRAELRLGGRASAYSSQGRGDCLLVCKVPASGQFIGFLHQGSPALVRRHGRPVVWVGQFECCRASIVIAQLVVQIAMPVQNSAKLSPNKNPNQYLFGVA
jgi:hypothetical protein